MSGILRCVGNIDIIKRKLDLSLYHRLYLPLNSNKRSRRGTITQYSHFSTVFFSPLTYSIKFKYKYCLVVSAISTMTAEETICKTAQTKNKQRWKHMLFTSKNKNKHDPVLPVA